MKKILLALLFPMLVLGQTVLKKPYDDLASGDLVVTNVSTSALMTNNSFTINGTPVGAGSNVVVSSTDGLAVSNIVSAILPTATVSYATSAGTATTALAVAWGGITGRPTVWPGTATDSVARIVANAANDAANAANTTGATHTAQLTALEGGTNQWNAALTNAAAFEAAGAIAIHNTNQLAHLTLASIVYVTNQLAGYVPRTETNGQVTTPHTYLESGLSALTTSVSAANATGATHTAQIATQEAFRAASTVNYATNAGNAATVGGLTPAQLSCAGVEYFVWGSLTGPLAGSKLAQLANPASYPPYTSTVSSVANGLSLGYASVKKNETPATLSGTIHANLAIDLTRGGAQADRKMRLIVAVYAADGITVVTNFVGELSTVPEGLSTLQFDTVCESTSLSSGRFLMLYFQTVSGWSGTDSIKVFSQDGYLTRVTLGSIGSGVFASQADFSAHTNRTDNPHAVTAAQINAVTNNGVVINGITLGNGTNITITSGTANAVTNRGALVLGSYVTNGANIDFQVALWSNPVTQASILTADQATNIAQTVVSAFGAPTYCLTNTVVVSNSLDFNIPISGNNIRVRWMAMFLSATNEAATSKRASFSIFTRSDRLCDSAIYSDTNQLYWAAPSSSAQAAGVATGTVADASGVVAYDRYAVGNGSRWDFLTATGTTATVIYWGCTNKYSTTGDANTKVSHANYLTPVFYDDDSGQSNIWCRFAWTTPYTGTVSTVMRYSK